MTRSQKIQKIESLKKVMKSASEMPADWKAYNKACDEIGRLNRSMLK